MISSPEETSLSRLPASVLETGIFPTVKWSTVVRFTNPSLMSFGPWSLFTFEKIKLYVWSLKVEGLIYTELYSSQRAFTRTLCHDVVNVSRIQSSSISTNTILGSIIFRAGNSRQCIFCDQPKLISLGLDPSHFLTWIMGEMPSWFFHSGFF